MYQYSMEVSSFEMHNSSSSGVSPALTNSSRFSPQTASSPLLEDSQFGLNDDLTCDENCKPVIARKSVTCRPKRTPGDRLEGFLVEETQDKILPDYLRENLDIVVVGINPGLSSVSTGHYYAGTGNHFWECCAGAGLTDKSFTYKDDYRLTEFGIGLTNVCARPTKGAADLTRKEMKEGLAILVEKMKKYQPKIVVFNGKVIYEVYIGYKHFPMGKQAEPLKGTKSIMFVMPSSSARCSQLPRAVDKLPFYTSLRDLRDHLNGKLPDFNMNHVVFTDYTVLRITKPDPKGVIKAEKRRLMHQNSVNSDSGAKKQIKRKKPATAGEQLRDDEEGSQLSASCDSISYLGSSTVSVLPEPSIIVHTAPVSITTPVGHQMILSRDDGSENMIDGATIITSSGQVILDLDKHTNQPSHPSNCVVMTTVGNQSDSLQPLKTVGMPLFCTRAQQGVVNTTVPVVNQSRPVGILTASPYFQSTNIPCSPLHQIVKPLVPNNTGSLTGEISLISSSEEAFQYKPIIRQLYQPISAELIQYSDSFGTDSHQQYVETSPYFGNEERQLSYTCL